MAHQIGSTTGSRAGLLTELFRLAKSENQTAVSLYDLEINLESARRFAEQFDFDSASLVFVDILTALQTLPTTSETIRLQAQCLTELANIRRDQGRINGLGGAYILYERARSLWRYLYEPGKLALTTWFLGACHEMDKNHGMALRFYAEALEIVDTCGGMETLRGRILLRIGTVLTKIGTLDAAEETITESRQWLEKQSPTEAHGFALQKLAIVRSSKGDVDSARRMVIDSLTTISESDKLKVTQTKLLLADLLFSSGQIDDGLQEASEAEILASRHGFTHQKKALQAVMDRHTTPNPSDSSVRLMNLSLQDRQIYDAYQILSDSNLSETILRELSKKLRLRYDSLDGKTLLTKARSLLLRVYLLDKQDELLRLLHNREWIRHMQEMGETIVTPSTPAATPPQSRPARSPGRERAGRRR